MQLLAPWVRNAPAAHDVQLLDPAFEKEPAEQFEHTEAVVPPALEENDPASHAVQINDPGLEENDPAAHDVQLLDPTA